jgi:heme-degrading monooxygenase HmoA
MIYELRHYIAKPGRAAELSARFRKHVLPIMRRHGLEVHDFWESADGSGELWYVMAWRDEAEMTRLWATFRGDRKWLAARAATEKEHGTPIASSTSVLLRRVPYFDRGDFG